MLELESIYKLCKFKELKLLNTNYSVLISKRQTLEKNSGCVFSLALLLVMIFIQVNLQVVAAISNYLCLQL